MHESWLPEQDVEQLYLIKRYREQLDQRMAFMEARQKELAERTEREMRMRATMEAERRKQELLAAERRAHEEEARRQKRDVESRVTFQFTEAELRAANPHEPPPPNGWTSGTFNIDEYAVPSLVVVVVVWNGSSRSGGGGDDDDGEWRFESVDGQVLIISLHAPLSLAFSPRFNV